MKCNVIDKGPCVKEMDVEVPVEEVKKSLEETMTHRAQDAILPGFRRGKVPMDMIKSHFGGEIREEVMHHLIEVSFREALKERHLMPIVQPKIESVEFAEDKPLRYKARVEIKSEAKVGNYIGMTVKNPPMMVKDEEVEHGLKELGEQFAEFLDVKDRAAVKGDFVMIDFEATVDGKSFKGGDAKDYFLELGSGVTIPGFEDQLVGVQPKEEREVSAIFPADFANKELANKKAVFKVRVKEVKQKKLPVINDEFAKDIGDFADLTALRTRIRENMIRTNEEKARGAMMDQIVSQLLETSTVDVPPTLLEAQVTRLLRENEASLRRQNLSYQDLGMDAASARQKVEGRAVSMVKAALLLDAIAEKEKIQVSDAELDEKIQAYARGRKQDPETLKKELTDRGSLELMRDSLLDDKTMDFLLSRAQIETESVITKPK